MLNDVSKWRVGYAHSCFMYIKVQGGDRLQAKEIVKLAEEAVMPILEEKGFEFVDCEFVKEGPDKYLRVYIDKEGGINIDDCEYVSRALDAKLGDDITDEPYIMEVSSPGIDRVLKRDKEYVKYKGRLVDVKLFKAKDGCKEFRGSLEGLVDNKVLIVTEDGQKFEFDRKDVAYTRLAVIF